MKKYLDLHIMGSTNRQEVYLEKEKFYLKSGNQVKIEFQLVAQGIENWHFVGS